MLKRIARRLGGADSDGPADEMYAARELTAPAVPLPPIFVGGTGRSGTHVSARLLGAHPSLYRVWMEVRFISAKGGLCDLVDGRTTMRRFEEQLLGPWWQRGESNGLSRIIERDAAETALKELRGAVGSRPLAAARAFTHRLLDPLALAHGAQGWIESEPSNAEVAGTLVRIFPDMHLIHSVRDGRDVACSIVPLHWGPTDVDDGLDWWAARVEEAFAACDTLPDDRLLVLQMEDLIERDRDPSYERLLSFLGIDDDPAMRAYFASDVTAEKAHIGRWHEDVPEDRRAAFDTHFQRLATALVARGRKYSWDGQPVVA